MYTHIHKNTILKSPEGEKTKGGGGTAVLCLLVSLGFTLLYFTLHYIRCAHAYCASVRGAAFRPRACPRRPCDGEPDEVPDEVSDGVWALASSPCRSEEKCPPSYVNLAERLCEPRRKTM